MAIGEWPVPYTTKDVRRFTGLCTYYRRFLPEFAAIAKPLHRLTEKGKAFAWTDECAAAFQRLKQVLTAAPVLAFPESDGDFIVDTDASDVGISYVLSQVHEGKEQVILQPDSAKNLSETIYHHLYGRKFLVRSDHASLQWLLRFKNPE